jgi:hypothetical protein
LFVAAVVGWNLQRCVAAATAEESGDRRLQPHRAEPHPCLRLVRVNSCRWVVVFVVFGLCGCRCRMLAVSAVGFLTRARFFWQRDSRKMETALKDIKRSADHTDQVPLPNLWIGSARIQNIHGTPASGVPQTAGRKTNHSQRAATSWRYGQQVTDAIVCRAGSGTWSPPATRPTSTK